MKQFLTREEVEFLNNSIKFSLPSLVISIGDLLEVLPETIYHEGKEYERTIVGSMVSYYNHEEGEALEINEYFKISNELIDNLLYICIGLKDTGLLNTGFNDPFIPICTKTRKDLNVSDDWDGFDDSYSTKSLNQTGIGDEKEGISDFEELDTSDLLSLEELRERSIKQPEEVSKGIYKLPVDFLNTTEEDYKKIKGKCFIRELGGFIVVRVEDIVSPQYSEFLYEQYDQYSDGSWNCKDYNWLQNTAAYDPEYKKHCLTDQTDMNVGSEEMYCLGKDGNLYVTLECGDEWLRFIPFDLDKFEKIKEEALRNFEEENGYDL